MSDDKKKETEAIAESKNEEYKEIIINAFLNAEDANLIPDFSFLKPFKKQSSGSKKQSSESKKII